MLALNDSKAIQIAKTYIQQKGFNSNDFKAEMLSKEKYPMAYRAYEDTIKSFECSDYKWVGFTSDKPNNPVLHVFIDAKTEKVIGHIKND